MKDPLTATRNCAAMEPIRRIFVYGTLMHGFHNHAAYLAAYPMTRDVGTVMGQLFHLPEGYPALVQGDGQVKGELMTLHGTEQEFSEVIASLDDLEGYRGENGSDNLYVRQIVSVTTAHGAQDAFCYYYADCERAARAGTLISSGDWRAFMQPYEEVRQIVVDADACPRGVLRALQRLKQEYGYRLITVASFNHHIEGTDHVTVGDGPDEADLAIVNRIRKGDIVVTQDWGLAALVLARGAQAISPFGQEYDPARIEFLLDERHTKAKARRAGTRTRGPKARTANDDILFEQRIRQLLSSRS